MPVATYCGFSWRDSTGFYLSRLTAQKCTSTALPLIQHKCDDAKLETQWPSFALPFVLSSPLASEGTPGSIQKPFYITLSPFPTVNDHKGHSLLWPMKAPPALRTIRPKNLACSRKFGNSAIIPKPLAIQVLSSC